MSNSASIPTKHTGAFLLQSIAAFAISSVGILIAIAYLDTSAWTKAFLAVCTLFLISSTITMSKVIRDREEATSVYQRVDAARLEKMLAEYDPLRPINLGSPAPAAPMEAFGPPPPANGPRPTEPARR